MPPNVREEAEPRPPVGVVGVEEDSTIWWSWQHNHGGEVEQRGGGERPPSPDPMGAAAPPWPQN